MSRSLLRPLPLLLPALCLALPAMATPTAPHPGASHRIFLDAATNTTPTLARRGGKGQKRGKKDHQKLTPEQRAEMRAKVDAKIDDYVRTTVATEVGLTDAKAQKLADLFKRGGEARHTKRKAMREEMKKLRALVDQGAGDAELNAQVKAVRNLRNQERDEGAVFDEAAAFLTAQEQARLVLAFPKMRKDMRHMMKRAKGHGHHGGKDGKGGKGGDTNNDERGGFGGDEQ